MWMSIVQIFGNVVNVCILTAEIWFQLKQNLSLTHYYRLQAVFIKKYIRKLQCWKLIHSRDTWMQMRPWMGPQAFVSGHRCYRTTLHLAVFRCKQVLLRSSMHTMHIKWLNVNFCCQFSSKVMALQHTHHLGLSAHYYFSTSVTVSCWVAQC